MRSVLGSFERPDGDAESRAEAEPAPAREASLARTAPVVLDLEPGRGRGEDAGLPISDWIEDHCL